MLADAIRRLISRATKKDETRLALKVTQMPLGVGERFLNDIRLVELRLILARDAFHASTQIIATLTQVRRFSDFRSAICHLIDGLQDCGMSAKPDNLRIGAETFWAVRAEIAKMRNFCGVVPPLFPQAHPCKVALDAPQPRRRMTVTTGDCELGLAREQFSLFRL